MLQKKGKRFQSPLLGDFNFNIFKALAYSPDTLIGCLEVQWRYRIRLDCVRLMKVLRQTGVYSVYDMQSQTSCNVSRKERHPDALFRKGLYLKLDSQL